MLGKFISAKVKNHSQITSELYDGKQIVNKPQNRKVTKVVSCKKNVS